MNDIMSVVGPFLVIAITIVMYVLVVQAMNNGTCITLGDDSQVVGKSLIRFLALCWM